MPRILRFCAFVIAALLMRTAAAQNHLKSQSRDDKQDKYNVYLRKVFNRIYRQDVVLSVLCIPSFVREEAAGILKTPNGYQAFSVVPSASTWQTEYHSIIRSFDVNNREIRWKPTDNTKEGLPTSYREITTRIQTRFLSPGLAERIRKLWQVKLLEALYPPPGPDESDRYIVTDSVSYHYSMPLQGHGWVTAEGRLVLENTPVWVMGEFSEALFAYANGKASEDDLEKMLRRVKTKKTNQAMQQTPVPASRLSFN